MGDPENVTLQRAGVRTLSSNIQQVCRHVADCCGPCRAMVQVRVFGCAIHTKWRVGVESAHRWPRWGYPRANLLSSPHLAPLLSYPFLTPPLFTTRCSSNNGTRAAGDPAMTAYPSPENGSIPIPPTSGIWHSPESSTGVRTLQYTTARRGR